MRRICFATTRLFNIQVETKIVKTFNLFLVQKHRVVYSLTADVN